MHSRYRLALLLAPANNSPFAKEFGPHPRSAENTSRGSGRKKKRDDRPRTPDKRKPYFNPASNVSGNTSPPTLVRTLDVEQSAPSPDEEVQMNDPQDPHATGAAYEFEVKEQDRWLPIANVARIMKNALPENAKIAKEAKECMQECVSEFISFITSEASEKCHQEKRKTVNGEDILFAMTSLGFENYAEALKIYLTKYREQQSASTRGEGQQTRPESQGGYPAGGGNAAPGSYAPGDLQGQAEAGDPPNFALFGGQPGHNGSGAEY
ncbi:hypothetical protein P8C59_007190 [Phyllachora maydis]|uniref:Transcription factor CBF/NF-Y/archaeal histone domain-containing protein n=1 Tax=Phyllachora maydis TaxID=1825666 RepID=A0AAD9I960_9PEZI|nr:hypothetical protein P8C59_007190 [Phyllachora maydis]